MSTRCWIAAALLLAAVCAHAPGQTPPASKARLQMRIYEVADLIIPLEKNPAPLNLPQSAPSAPVVQAAAAVPCPTVTTARGEPSGTLEEQLIRLLTSRIAPESWTGKGGPGSVDYYPLGMALVVNQTPAVHKQVRHLLESLRKLQDVEVAVEVRFVSMSEPFFEKIGIDFNKTDAKLSAPPVGVTFLDGKQLRDFLETAQGDQGTNVMQAPKLTVANGQRAEIKVEDRQYFVSNVKMVEAAGQFTFIPTNASVATGFALSVQPVVSSDRRHVRLNMKVTHTSLASPEVPEQPIVATVTPPHAEGTPDKPMLLTQHIQQPKITSATIEKTQIIPDGQSVLFGGWKSVREARTEFGDPVLSKIPYVNRLFKNVGYGRETETLVLLVTPRIIVHERKEDVSAKGEKAKEKKLAKYDQACKDGKLEEAKKLARKARELDPTCFHDSKPGALQQTGYEGKDPEDLGTPASPGYEQADHYYKLAQKARAENSHEQYQSWLAKAEAAYTEVMQELQGRLAERALSREEDQLLRKSSFAVAECRFLQGEYATSSGIYEAMAIRYERQPDGLHALAGMVQCYLVQQRKEDAQATVERARAMLKEMDDTAFQKSHWTRQQWEDWLAEAGKWFEGSRQPTHLPPERVQGGVGQ